MSKNLRLIALSSLILSFNVFAKPVIELYKSPTCGELTAAWRDIGNKAKNLVS